MQQKQVTDQGKRVLELVQKWRMETLDESENRELCLWFYALEGTELGPPIETTVNVVERRLHEQLFNQKGVNVANNESIPHPWHEKKSNLEK